VSGSRSPEAGERAGAMTARDDYDVGPLSWVKGRDDHASSVPKTAVRAFAAAARLPTQLKAANSTCTQAPARFRSSAWKA